MEEKELVQVAEWLKVEINKDAPQYGLDDIIKSYKGLMEFNGKDYNKRELGLDLVLETLKTIHKKGSLTRNASRG